VASCSDGIPDEVGGWRVEVGPPGNEFYEPPPPPEEVTPPSSDIFSAVELIAPSHTEVKRWEAQDESRYFIRAEAGPEEYDFLFSLEGKLLELEYENDLETIDEAPGEIILAGSGQEIPLSEVPESTIETLKAFLPDVEPSEALSVSSVAGPRYVVVLGELAFFARPDGQIQAAGSVAKGALKEVDPNGPGSKDQQEVLAEAAQLLAPHRERFSLDNQMKKLSQDPGDSFRFVIIGDSRSNPDLWPNIVKHINMLDPKPKFIINTGDIVQHGWTKEYLEYFIPPLVEVDIPFFVAIGNHDDGSDGSALEYRYLFGDDSLNHHFDYGGWRFILLDNVTTVRPYQETLGWLEKTLFDTPDGQSILVATHKPLSTIEKWAYHSWDPENSQQFAGMMIENRVDQVFFGHIHAYSTATMDGIPYTITGGGGAGLHDRYGPQGNVHHYLICDVERDGSFEQQVVRFYRKEQGG
jgi:3',5'-cyclic AMP phosphodiesterase CpdA